MSNKTLTIGFAVAIVIAVGGFLFPQVPAQIQQVLGANPGPDFYTNLVFHQNFTRSGDIVATSSTEATFTLTTEFISPNVNLVSWNSGLNNTLTTMASTVAPFNTMATGESFSIYFYSATTTAATTITFAAGSGVDIQFGEATGGDLVLNGADVAILTFIKKADNNILFIFNEFTEGD